MTNKKYLLSNTVIFASTERVFLTILQKQDKQTYLALLIQPEDNQIVPSGYPDWSEYFWKNANSESTLSLCIWDQKTNAYIGYCLYHKLHTDKFEIGIQLSEEYQNMGLGYEICTKLIEVFFQRTTLPYIYYQHFRSNKKSAHLIEKLGGELIHVNSPFRDMQNEIASLSDKFQKKLLEFDTLTYHIRRP